MASISACSGTQIVRTACLSSERFERAARVASTVPQKTASSSAVLAKLSSGHRSTLASNYSASSNFSCRRAQRTKLFAQEPEKETSADGDEEEADAEASDSQDAPEEGEEESSAPAEVIAALAQKEAALAELATIKDTNLRLQADFDNFRKRTAREKEQLSQQAKASVMESLLTVIDNFELAKENLKPEGEGEEKINSSYQQLYTQLVDVLRSLGLTVVGTVGEQFNPEIHDAIMREPTSEAKEDTVTQEFRRGFMFNGSLLRPAMVKVAVAEEPKAEASENSEEETESEEAASS